MIAIAEIGGTQTLLFSSAFGGGAFTGSASLRSLSYSACTSLAAFEENGVVRNKPLPTGEPSSFNLRPSGVRAGKSVSQVPQGCPVWRAKLGKACADGASPIVNHAARTMISTSATANLKFRSEPSRRMASPCDDSQTRTPMCVALALGQGLSA